MDGGFRGVHTRLAGRACRFRGGGGIARTELVSGVEGGDVMWEEGELRRVRKAEHGQAAVACAEADGEHAADHWGPVETVQR